MAEYPTMWNGPGATPPAGGPATHQMAAPPDAPSGEPPVVGKRTLAEVAALLDNMRYAVDSHRYELEEFHEGVQATYRWAVGQGPSPITGRAAGVPDARQLRAEDDAAEAAMHGPRRRFANGVQHAAMWLRGATQDQPWPVWET